MVRGLDLFKNYFKEFNETYILIGGAACDQWMEEIGMGFRVTKDLDVILVVEVISDEFIKHFWEFIKAGNYKTREESYSNRKVYRFSKPGNPEFPMQVELFSRKPDILGDFKDYHLAPIPAGDDISSLSAIIMNEDYYHFTIKHSQIIDELPLADTYVLICLKIKAYLDLKERKDNREAIDSGDIKKHLKDIARLCLTSTGEEKIKLPTAIAADVTSFIHFMEEMNPDLRDIGKAYGVKNYIIDKLIDQLKSTFEL